MTNTVGRGGARGGRKGGRKNAGGARTVAVKRAVPVVREPVTLPPVLSVAELAEKLEINGIEIIRELMKVGIMANLNQQIDYDTAARVAETLGWETNEQESVAKSKVADFESRRLEGENDPHATPRPP
ncbi:MAG: translation initiation factor IF-2 N-terminal domain-containing protein, partial [Thermomicrobiales bacterium]